MGFKFSVIIPIYNVEKYLEETILSVVNQTIGFEKNIQMILVNDGSPDNSKAICEKYQKLYPNNVMYIEQENSGVSAARNKGLEYATGEYINFLDSDDVWEKNVFKVALKMFESNPGLPLIGVRQKYFEASKSYTSLNYKFLRGNRVVDMQKEFDSIQLSVTSAFFAREYIKDTVYDTRIKYSEDAKFIYEVLIKNNKTHYGIIANPLHLYRKRYSQNSAIQTKDLKPDWYFITTELSYNYLLDLAKEKCPELLRNIAYYVAYDYQWRIRVNIDNFLSAQDKEKYLDITKKLFSKIPDECILEQKQIDALQKIIILNYKYDNNYKQVNQALKNSEQLNMFLDICEMDDEHLIVEGYPQMPGTNVTECYIKLNNKYKKVNLISRKYPECKNFMDATASIRAFKLKLKLKEISSLEFYIVNNKIKEKMNIVYGDFAKLSDTKSSYYSHQNTIMEAMPKCIKVRHNQNVINKVLHEIKFLASVKQIKSIIIRLLYKILPKSKKQIWIFSDRYDVAGDNGEQLFKYVNQQNNKNIKTYFVIKKGAKDVERLKTYGKVIYYNTLKYMLLFLRSDYIISSHFDEHIINCFGKNKNLYKDLFTFKYVFLQHGIIRNDLSSWLNKYNRNISMFVTSTKAEYESIIKDNYYYDTKAVKLTGLPRYDNLYNNNEETKKQILIMPTWRAYLLGSKIDKHNRMYNDKFKESYFYKTYNSLLNDERIHQALKEYGYKMKFCLHPMIKVQQKDFKTNDYVEIISSNVDYQYEFKTNKIMVTDYSSVSCDFAYLKKPVIYIRGDKEEFYANHTYSEGFFDEEKEGFGSVAYDYEQAVEIIIKAIKNDGKMEEKYIKNVNKFFKFHDGDNCKRVYQEILKLK